MALLIFLALSAAAGAFMVYALIQFHKESQRENRFEHQVRRGAPAAARPSGVVIYHDFRRPAAVAAAALPEHKSGRPFLRRNS